MQGTKACPGVIPRVVEVRISSNAYSMVHDYKMLLWQAMFEQKVALQKSNVELAVSYMEIYKDECYDLLVDRETVRSNVY
jgi:kinesin family protein 22